MVFIAYWHYETEQPSPLSGYLWYWRSHQKYCVPVIHESVLPHISTAETQRNITGMPHYLYRYLLKQGSEGIHRNGLIGILQDHILKQVKYVIGKVFSIWKMIYKVAMIEEIPVRDIPSMVDVPQSRKVNPRALKEWNITEEDFQHFCKFFSFYGSYEPWEKEKIYKRDIILYMIKLMRVTALRPQEVKALSKSDFVFGEVTFTEKVSNEVITVPCVRINIVKSVGSTRTED